MNINDKIYVAGHRGLVGSAIINVLKTRWHHEKTIGCEPGKIFRLAAERGFKNRD